ncbi:unnamed protein product [Brachionus calyciflorus]|uniref:BZIP domain-containing protein n=1 Tax=Brachionus calyciflorus TaxID=104777 RepID=A0A813N961_9BILA|nr:unnamed protein product [Brachionus calyciflorus]
MDSNSKDESKNLPSVLETPQVNSFEHENVFAQAFKNALLNRTISTHENLDPLVPLIPTVSPSIVSDTPGGKAPKKSILFRTISQNDLELQKQEVLKKAENTNETNNQCLATNNLNCNENINHVPSILFELSKPKVVDSNQIYDLKSNQTLNSTSIDLKDIYKREIPIMTQLSHIQDLSSKRIRTDSVSSFEFSKESTTKPDSVLSNSNSSSFDDIVSSSDQTDEKKIKKKRTIDMNSEERKLAIRSSNREAARRCRERKRKYIDFLELKIKELEAKTEELLKENIELKKLHTPINSVQSNPIPIILNVPSNQISQNQLLLNLHDKNYQENQNFQKVYQMLVSNKQINDNGILSEIK